MTSKFKVVYILVFLDFSIQYSLGVLPSTAPCRYTYRLTFSASYPRTIPYRVMPGGYVCFREAKGLLYVHLNHTGDLLRVKAETPRHLARILIGWMAQGSMLEKWKPSVTKNQVRNRS